MRALYDFSRQLACFNIAEWLVCAKTLGAESVVFDMRMIRTKKWPYPVIMKRIESICLPMPALAGLPHETVTTGLEPRGVEIGKANGKMLVEFWNSYGKIERLKSVSKPQHERYTVTLRNTERSPLRNSDERVWRDFAAEIGARVIPDYAVEPIHLHDRMALYAGAEMNFFVSNGPGVLCSLSEYPGMMFNAHHALGSYQNDGMGGWGCQYPWSTERFRLVWEEATPENLRRHFYHWRKTGGWLAPPPEPIAPAA